eukprot:UN20504
MVVKPPNVSFGKEIYPGHGMLQVRREP